MKRFFLVLSAAILLALGACQKAPELTVTGPASIELSADGSSGSITFTANRDWTVSWSESWVHVSPAYGKASDGPVTLSVTCSPNTTYEDRTATVTIKAEGLTQSVTVKQPQNLGVIVPTKSYNLESGANTFTVEVQANVPYSVSSSVDWIKQTGTKALTSTTYVFSVDENTTYDDREGTVTIKSQNSSVADQVISVKQQAKDGLELGTTIYEVGVSGGTLEIALKTNVELEVIPGADWIHYTQTKALDNRTVVLSIDRNDGSTERGGEGKISQKGGTLSSTVTVKQEGPVRTDEHTAELFSVAEVTLDGALESKV
jgi:endoglucanase